MTITRLFCKSVFDETCFFRLTCNFREDRYIVHATSFESTLGEIPIWTVHE